MAVPGLVVESVSAILRPYGVDFASMLKQEEGKEAYLTPRQASELCGLSPKTLRVKVQSGEIRAIRVGEDRQRSRVLIDKRHLFQWLGKMPSASTKTTKNRRTK